ncbi:ABC transporter ATP-binding protein [Spirochaetia bacterium 38H-sp]|uniref:ABC transporter ATP-binding protein n=1 Tax=Rarispira pelagica TaxID=3141764 RepID=A0ABU9U8G1_9SPIR
MDNRTLISVDRLSFSFYNQKVLYDICLDILPGQLLSIMGPNGSGKTTLLRLISRILSTTKKTIYIEGKDITELRQKEIAKVLAYVPQHIYDTFDFSVMDVVLMGRWPHLSRLQAESHKDREIVLSAMESLGVLELAEKSIREISGGELQRVIIARALAQEPDVLVLDEPTSHLDPGFSHQVMRIVRNVCRERGVGMIATFHDINTASFFSDRIVCLKSGRLVADGIPEEVIVPQILRELYGVDFAVMPHPENRRPFVMPL